MDAKAQRMLVAFQDSARVALYSLSGNSPGDIHKYDFMGWVMQSGQAKTAHDENSEYAVCFLGFDGAGAIVSWESNDKRAACTSLIPCFQ